jgi:hypothetical protein
LEAEGFWLNSVSRLGPDEVGLAWFGSNYTEPEIGKFGLIRVKPNRFVSIWFGPDSAGPGWFGLVQVKPNRFGSG